MPHTEGAETMRTIHAIAGLAVFAAIATGCSTHHAATATHSPVHAATRTTTPPKPAPTHTATHSAPAPTATPDPYVAYEQLDVQSGVASWDADQAARFSATLCGNDDTARTAEIATDWSTVDGGLFSKVDMLNNVSNLLRAYCPTHRNSVLDEYDADK